MSMKHKRRPNKVFLSSFKSSLLVEDIVKFNSSKFGDKALRFGSSEDISLGLEFFNCYLKRNTEILNFEKEVEEPIKYAIKFYRVTPSTLRKHFLTQIKHYFSISSIDTKFFKDLASFGDLLHSFNDDRGKLLIVWKNFLTIFKTNYFFSDPNNFLEQINVLTKKLNNTELVLLLSSSLKFYFNNKDYKENESESEESKDPFLSLLDYFFYERFPHISDFSRYRRTLKVLFHSGYLYSSRSNFEDIKEIIERTCAVYCGDDIEELSKEIEKYHRKNSKGL